MADVEDSIGRLYQLPLDEFTPARNALAKESKQPAIKALEKPNVAAWAVNQLYWKERPTYDRLVKAVERLRGEHRKLLSGKSSDIRDAEKSHRDVIREAIDSIRDLLEAAGQSLSPATLTAVQETLEALPASDAPGRLTRPLKPLGFEALSGVAIKPALRVVERPPAKETPRKAEESAPRDTKKDRAREQQLAKQREKEEQERKERQREAERELKRAEAAMLRAEEAVKKAEKALGELRAARDEAVSEYQRARLRAHE
jgi:hypothetical protein